MKKPIYLDNAATTPLNSEASQAMVSLGKDLFYNASALYPGAKKIHEKIDEARHVMAQLLGASAREIYFTSGGTEANNWALRGIFEPLLNPEFGACGLQGNKQTNHLIVSAIEHHSVLEVARYLERRGVQVTYLPVNSDGQVAPDVLANAMQSNTRLVSVMLANNEVGSLQPIAELSQIAHRSGALFHTDAVQAFGHIPCNVEELGVDMLSISAHKFSGPKGVGALYVRSGLQFEPLIFGGSQERGKRAGTENVAGIVAMKITAQSTCATLNEDHERVSNLRDYFAHKIVNDVPDVLRNGSLNSLPGILNVTIKGVNAEALLFRLAQNGVYASAGSACSAGSFEPSHVLLALGLTKEEAKQSIRFSLSSANTKEEVDFVCSCLKELVEYLRSL